MISQRTPRDVKNESAWRQPYLWFVLALPATAVIAGLLTLFIAVHSSDGLVADDYYKRGLMINQDLHRDVKARDYGLSAQLKFDAPGQTLRVRLRANRDFRYPERAVVRLIHPTRAGSDESITLQHIGGEEYVGRYLGADRGRRHVQIEADDWRLLQTYRLP